MIPTTVSPSPYLSIDINLSHILSIPPFKPSTFRYQTVIHGTFPGPSFRQQHIDNIRPSRNPSSTTTAATTSTKRYRSKARSDSITC
mmetsp:Transcript_6582/g.9644  ORF Transcript_6582/g.9644 Transcript_6582/m.9644 type:complete len:87 (-) Transcript_6582:2134-2394(-)